MDDLISRETMKDKIDRTTWYHQNRNKDMVEGASDEGTAWYKAEDVFKAIENVPTAQVNTPTDTPTDTIYRQEAIDAIAEMGFRKSSTVKAILCRLETLPSAQPEIVRCEDCRWWDKSEDSPFGYCMAMKHGYMSANWEIGIYRRYKGDFYCADAERRIDE